LFFAARVASTNYLERPIAAIDTNQLFQDNLLVLGSIGLSHRDYTKDQLIFAFGITEDVPEGFLYELTAGHEFREFFDRWYLGGKFGKGKYLKNRGYLNISTEIGGFLRQGRVNQAVLSGTLQGFSHLYHVGRTQFRQFLGANYTIGKRRFDTEYIDIRDANGIRGLKSTRLRGRQRLVISTESVFFTPIHFIGFRLATMAFVDLGWITPENVSPFAKQIQAGVGIGVRLRNDNLAFRTFQLSFTWFPNAPIDADNFDFRFSSVPRLRLNDFDVQKPDVLRFD